jgi:hypothetical protein
MAYDLNKGEKGVDRPILKPLSVPELLDKGFQIYKRHVWLFLSIAALIQTPAMVIESFFVVYLGNDSLGNIVGNLLSPFVQLALTLAVSNLYLGKEISIRTSYSQSAYKYSSLFWANILIGLAIGVPSAILGILFIWIVPIGILAALFLLPLVVFLSTRWSLSTPAIVLEHVGASKGLGRSWALTEGYFWRVFGTSFAASLLALILSLLPVLFINYLSTELFQFPYQVVGITNVVVEKLALIFSLPFSVAVNVLIYYDLRIRKEGLDLLEMIGSTEEGDDDDDDIS